MTTFNDDDARHRVDQLLDKPIDTVEADLLGFRQVAESLVGAISAQPNGASLTLGLDGPWGSGKSSILSLLRRSLEDAPHDNGIGIVVVPFSPWLITNRTALVSAFFAQLSTAIDRAEKRIPRDWYFFRKSASKKLSSARKQLNSFSKFASIASTAASAFDPTLVSAAATGSIKAVEKMTDDNGKPGKTLETMKQELGKVLAKIAAADPSFRILVLVDDLDRLDPSDALEVLRLVKAVGDFPATTYLLAYDRSAIARAIQNGAKIDNGDLYLEKIIQFSFKVPPLEPFQLRNWLKSELDRLFPDTFNHASSRTSAVLDCWAGRLISTPRDVKRLLFAIRAIWPNLQGRADLLDLIWLQMLAQKASEDGKDLYSWVVGYLQGLEAVAIGGTVTGMDEERTVLIKILKDLGWKEYEHGKPGSSLDFHYLDELLAGITSNHLSANENDWTYKTTNEILHAYRDEKRLASPWHWRLYFALDTPSHAVTDDEWLALVQAADKSTADLSNALGTVLDFRSAQRRDTADQIIGRATHAQSTGSLAHPDRWITAIVERAEAMGGLSKKDAIFGFTKLFEISLKSFARLVFKSISGTEREAALTAIFKQNSTLCPAANLLRDQYHASKKEGYDKEERYFLSDDELSDLISSQVSLYEALTPSDLRSLTDPYDVLYAWKDVAESYEGPAKLLVEAFKEDGEFLETLSSLRYISSSAQNGVPHIPEDFLKNLVDVKATKARLKSLADGVGEHSEKAIQLLDLWWESDH